MIIVCLEAGRLDFEDVAMTKTFFVGASYIFNYDWTFKAFVYLYLAAYQVT